MHAAHKSRPTAEALGGAREPRGSGKADRRETYVPTQHPQAGEDPRVPRANGQPGRSGGAPGQAAEAAASPVGLSEVATRSAGRVRQRRAFVALRRPAGRAAAGPLRVNWVPDGAEFPQVAYAIGRRCGGAVQRNRLRRRLRAAVAKAGAPPGYYLVTADRSAADLAFADLSRAVGSAMTSAAAKGSRR